MRRALAPLALSLSLACGDSAGDSATAASSTSVTTATNSGPASTTDEPTSTGAGSGSGSQSSGSSGVQGPKLDVGADTTTAEPGEGCPSVDILFVIDSSGSMADQQDSLIASFPGFIAAVQSQLGGAKSYHIGVVTSSDYYENAQGCGTIGDLITKTGGPESSGKNCQPFSSGARFLDESEPDLGAKFACVGKVGTGGSDDERMIRGMLDALRPDKNGPQGCNANFSRPEALLVVVLITDEDDVPDGCDGMTCDTYGSGGTKEEWFAELLSYRNQIAQNIVVLSLIGRQLDNPCGAVPAARLLGFTGLFDERGFVGDVCAADYAPFFAEALPVIGDACVHWVPPA